MAIPSAVLSAIDDRPATTTISAMGAVAVIPVWTVAVAVISVWAVAVAVISVWAVAVARPDADTDAHPATVRACLCL